ncbi:MAG: glutamate synthase large subunit, partial [Rhodobacteraceae bacterium]|nr:glutamate synthase large subunit [Paracoccaceae bacterium]
VGVATQDPVLRARFTGQPEHVINYFFFVAEELRQIMAEMGFRTVEEMVGRVDRIDMRRVERHWKAHGVDLKRILHPIELPEDRKLYHTETQDHGLANALDIELIEACKPAIQSGQPIEITREVRNVNRTVGAMLSGEVARAHGHGGLSPDTIRINFTGVAGQSFGAWLAHGVTISLTGDANDYVGKGLSGGTVVVRPPMASPLDAGDNTIIGNTVLYGATDGHLFAAGRAGERFAVRNSGAKVVVEGCGSNGCEYMTGGVAVILGGIGANFGAGMTGGMAYVWDPEGEAEEMMNLDSIVTSAVSHPHWESELRGLIERHAAETGSRRAARILQHWETERANFVQICPKEMLTRIAHPLSPESQAVPAE